MYKSYSYQSRRRPYRRPYYKRRPVNKSTVAKIAKKVAYSTRPKRECRFNIFHPLDSSLVATSFGVDHLTDIQQGLEVDNRSGKTIFLKGIKFNVSFANNSSTKPRALRFLLVHTRNRDGDLLDTTSWTDLYQSSTFADRPADSKSGDIVSPINRDILDVYFDKVFTLSAETANHASTLFSKYIKIGRQVHYDDSGSPGASPQLTSGRFYSIVHLCEPDDTVSADVLRVTGMARVFYSDA